MFPPTLIATRTDCSFASAGNPGRVSVKLAVVSSASRAPCAPCAMTKVAYDCCVARSSGEPLVQPGLDTAYPAAPIFIVFMRVFIVLAYIKGAAVPSDHLPTVIMKTSIGSGAPLNCGFSMTGELGISAPQEAPFTSGV